MSLELLQNNPEQPLEGPPLLFIHGMGHSAWFWQQNFFGWFADRGVKVYALSLRGHGESPGAQKLKWTPLSRFVEDIRQTVKELGQEPESTPVLVGHSMGGYLLQKYLCEIREGQAPQPPAMILMAPVPRSGVLGSSLMLMRKAPLVTARVTLTQSTMPILNSPENIRDFLFSGNITREEAATYLPHMGEESFLGFLQMYQPVRCRKPENMPMLILRAGRDHMIPAKALQKTAHFYGADLETIDTSSHEMMLDPAWEETATTLLSWCRAQGFFM